MPTHQASSSDFEMGLQSTVIETLVQASSVQADSRFKLIQVADSKAKAESKRQHPRFIPSSRANLVSSVEFRVLSRTKSLEYTVQEYRSPQSTVLFSIAYPGIAYCLFLFAISWMGVHLIVL